MHNLPPRGWLLEPTCHLNLNKKKRNNTSIHFRISVLPLTSNTHVGLTFYPDLSNGWSPGRSLKKVQEIIVKLKRTYSLLKKTKSFYIFVIL